MSYATAAFADVTAFGGREFTRGNYRPINNRRTGIGVRTAAFACTIGFATVAAVWLVAVVLSGRADIPASPSIDPAAVALFDPQPVMPGAGDFSDPERIFARPVYVRRFELAHRAPSMQVAALTPRTSARADIAPLAPKRASARADVPLPRARPLFSPPIQAAHEIARAPLGEAGPRVAAIASPPAPTVAPRFSPQPADNKSLLLRGPESRTAVYDISAHTVYLPNGERLEAHSGLGDKLDDPRFVKVRMRGPTPPNVYDLALREQPFHGVRAIRLNPVDDNKMYGRDGMLAHTYMLGRSGQSFGCVSFKDYPKFLQAYLKGDVERLVVVAKLDSAPTPVARARRGHGDRYAFNSR